MNRASFGALMSNGGQKMKYGKKKTSKPVKKKVMKKKAKPKKKGYKMPETKDVEVHVSGVSMTGAVKDDNKRSASTDQKKSGEKKA